MATRPEFPATFAYLDVNLPSTGETNKLRPPIEVRETGYDFLQKPPAEEVNWILNNVGAWIQYLDELTREQGVTEIATKAQAETGVASDVLMTPERTLESIKFNSVPVGTVFHTARTTPPSSYFVCDGTAVSRSTYSRLFSAIGTTFGTGDGSTTFNIPDLRDEFIRGANASGGRPVGTTEAGQLGSHSHTGTTNSAGSHSHPSMSGTWSGNDGGFPSSSTNNLRTGAGAQADAGITNFSLSSAGEHTHTFTTGTTGGSETRPQNVALLPIIKF